jgi:PDZ domain-containing protein
MAINGDVGDVGGVAQKTVAVRNAGAVLFLVPPEELSVARAHAGPTLKVVAVSTIGQAIAALEHIGGRLVTRSGK